MAIRKRIAMHGVHMLVDFFGVAEKKLQDRDALMNVLHGALKRSGFRIIKESGSHKFKGGGKGVTGFILLAQSHAAFHSYPEYGYMALDIYFCGKCDPNSVTKEIVKYLAPRKVSRAFYRRG